MDVRRGGQFSSDLLHPFPLHRIREIDESSSRCSTSDGSCFSVSSCSLQQYMASNLSISASSTFTENDHQPLESTTPYRPTPRSSLRIDYSLDTNNFLSLENVPYVLNSLPSNEESRDAPKRINNQFSAKALGKCSAPRSKTDGTQNQSLDLTLRVVGRKINGSGKTRKTIKREADKQVDVTANYTGRCKGSAYVKQDCQKRATLPVTSSTKGTGLSTKKDGIVRGRAALAPLSITPHSLNSPTTAKVKQKISDQLMITGVRIQRQGQIAAPVALPFVDSKHVQDEEICPNERQTKLEKKLSYKKIWRP